MFIIIGQDHDVWMVLCVDPILIPLHVVPGIPDLQLLVAVEGVGSNGDGTPSQILHPGLWSCGAQEAGHSGLGGCTEDCHVTASLNCTWHMEVDPIPEVGLHSHVPQSSSF